VNSGKGSQNESTAQTVPSGTGQGGLAQIYRRELSRGELEEVLGVGKTRFFALLKEFHHDPKMFLIEYERSTLELAQKNGWW
jgi:hypothetical protein